MEKLQNETNNLQIVTLADDEIEIVSGGAKAVKKCEISASSDCTISVKCSITW